MVKIGIIGLGRMGGYHASACNLINDINLVGVSDLDQENLNKIKNPQTIKSQDYNDWLNLVDGVIIAVPTQFHYKIAKDCLSKSKHVLVEKPITKNINQAEELFEIAKKENCALHIGHVERFNGAIQELKNIIQNPYLIECHRIGPFAPRVQNDSVIIDLMIHDIDLILHLVDSPVKYLNLIGNKITSNLTDIAVVQIKFENGVLANIVSSRTSQTKERTMSIHQSDAFIKLDFTTQDISIYRHSNNSVKISSDQMRYRQESTIERLFVYKDNPLKLEIENFVKSIQSGKNLFDATKDIASLNITIKLEEMAENEFNDCSSCRNGKFTSPSMS